MKSAFKKELSHSPIPQVEYINFPTWHLGNHVLMLRPSWPDDLPEPAIPPIPNGPIGFGQKGAILTAIDKEGRTVVALQVMPHWRDGLPDFLATPWPGALASLHTALRYTGMGWLEAGPMAFSPVETEFNAIRATLLWEGLIRILERNGLGFVLGVESGGTPDADAPISDLVPRLLEVYGLPDEFAYRPKKFRPTVTYSSTLNACSNEEHQLKAILPLALREALTRGARLTGEPLLDSLKNRQFFWVGYHGALSV